MKTRLRVCALAAAAATVLPSTALAAPVTVTLRVEGPDATLYEGPVTTDVRTFRFTNDDPDSAAFDERTPVRCDAVGDSAATPSPTIGGVLATAAEGGTVVDGTYFDFETGPAPFVKFIGGVPATFSWSLTYSVFVGAANQNWGSTQYGVCGVSVANGDEILLALGAGSAPLLKLTGVPATLAPGATATATVVNGRNGQPVAGAAIDGRTTGADGTVQIGPFTSTGPRILKATKDGAVRSNGGQVCVTDGADGACGTVKPIAATPQVIQAAQTGTPGGPTGCQSFGDDGRCGTPDEMPPLVRLTNLTSKVYTRAQAPRELTGQAGNFRNGTTFLADPSGIKDVRLRITRYLGARCWTYNGKAERFSALRRCGTGNGRFFSVGNKAEWSYLMPRALPRGKYRVEAFAIDGKGNADKVRRWNRNHVVFRVR